MENRIILMADDDTDDTELFYEATENIDNHVECVFADNGSDVLQKLEALEKGPELIFLDLNMPVMNGWECLELLKENRKYSEIPVIMISTSSHRQDIDKALKMGALCYFVKPNGFRDLLHVLTKLTENFGPELKSAVAQLEREFSGLIFVKQTVGSEV